MFERELQAIPSIVEVLDSLICRICVASSGRPERLKHALSLVGLYDRFHPHIFSAVEVARGKPAPDLFLHAAARMGTAPERARRRPGHRQHDETAAGARAMIAAAGSDSHAAVLSL